MKAPFKGGQGAEGAVAPHMDGRTDGYTSNTKRGHSISSSSMMNLMEAIPVCLGTITRKIM
jgi:hypothetical protein